MRSRFVIVSEINEKFVQKKCKSMCRKFFMKIDISE